MSRHWAPRLLADMYTTVVRGVPELLVIFLVFFGGSFVLQWAFSLFGNDEYVEVSAFTAGVMALSVVFGAFATEVFRGAFQAVPRGQLEAGVACGMSRWQVFGRIHLPQMWRFALPGLGNLWIILIKDTTLVSVIALDELVRFTNIAVGATKQPFTFYFAAALIYWSITLVSERASRRLERAANRGVRRA
jgi:ABC-type arginine transport system permease subunit